MTFDSRVSLRLAYVPSLSYGKTTTQNTGFKIIAWAEVSSDWPSVAG